jgi:hypothetical protein
VSWSTTSAFDAINTLESKGTPVWVVEFEGTQYNSSDVFFCTGAFDSIPGTYYKLLLNNGTLSAPTFDIVSNTQQNGYYDFSIAIDSDNRIILDVLSNYGMNNRNVVVKLGFSTLGIGDFTQVYTGKVRSYSVDSMKAHFVADIGFIDPNLPIIKEEAFVNTQFASDHTNTDTALDCDDLTAFNSNILGSMDYEHQGYRPLVYVPRRQEAMTYSLITTAGTPDVINVIRDAINIPAANAPSITTDDEIRQIYQMTQYNIGELICRIMTSTAAGTNGDYDIGADIPGFGLGISSSLVNHTQIINECYKLGHFNSFEKLIFHKEERFGEWMQRVLLRNIEPAFFYIDESNKYALRLPDIVEDDAAVTITREEMGQSFTYTALDQSVVTQKTVIFDHPEIFDKDFQVQLPFRSTTPWSNGVEAQETIHYTIGESVSELATKYDNVPDPGSVNESPTSFVYELPDKLRRSLSYSANGAVELTFDARIEHITYQVGDVIDITNDMIPNLDTAARGVTNLKGIIVAAKCGMNQKPVFTVLLLDAWPSRHNIISDSNIIAEGNITRKAATYSTNTTTTIEAADAYYDNSTTQHDGNLMFAKVRITPPNTATDSLEHVRVEFKFVDALTSGTEQVFDGGSPLFGLPYNPSNSAAIEYRLCIYAYEPVTNVNYIGMDYSYRSSSSGNQPTVELVGLEFYVENIEVQPVSSEVAFL